MEKKTLAALLWMWLGIAIYWGCENIFVALYFSSDLIIPPGEQSALFIGWLVAMSAIANILGMWVSGPASDACRMKLGRRRPYIMIGGILAGSIMMLFPLVKFFPTTPTKFAAALVIDCSMSFCGDLITGPRFALLTELTTPQDRATINGYLNIPNVLGMAFPVVIAGLSSSVMFMDSFFYVGGSFIIASTVSSSFLIKEPARCEDQLSFRQYFRKAFTLMNYRSNKSFYRALAGVALLALGGSVFYPYMFPYIEKYIGLTGTTYLVAAASILLINLAVQIPIGKLSDKRGRKFIFKYILPIDGLALAMVFFIGPGDVVPLVLIGGPAITFYFTLKIVVQSWMQDLCPEDQRASLFIYNTMADVLMMAPGSLIGGLLLDTFTAGTTALYHPVIFLVAAMIMASSAFVFVKIPESLKIEGLAQKDEIK
ncbi:MAG: MFS transporter [Candidatus Lokiarchaeota archaeon]|nr:MFS transporter [Candidatus Lokiarchaeota archaeon]